MDGIADKIAPTVQRYLGGPDVDYAEIEGVLSQANLAMQFVRESSFGPNLANIAYIYNSSSGGSFGVFDPNVDRSVKIKVVEDGLKSQGFGTSIKDGRLYAWKSGIAPEEVSREMEKLFEKIDERGGVVIGINAASIMTVARRNFEALQREIASAKAKGESVQEADQSDLDIMVALHLGSTIVHETVHASGAESEDAPISAQRAWTDEVLGKINSQRRSQGRFPLQMSGET